MPKDVIKRWDAQKNKLGEIIDRMPKTGIGALSPEDRKRIKADLGKVFSQFDSGLKAKMKVAAAAKTPDAAKKSALAVADVADDYKKVLTKQMATWGSASVSQSVGQKVSDLLDEIKRHAEMQSRQQATTPSPAFFQHYEKMLASMSPASTKVSGLPPAATQEWATRVSRLRSKVDEGFKAGHNRMSSGPLFPEEMLPLAQAMVKSAATAEKNANEWLKEIGKWADHHGYTAAKPAAKKIVSSTQEQLKGISHYMQAYVKELTPR